MMNHKGLKFGVYFLLLSSLLGCGGDTNKKQSEIDEEQQIAKIFQETQLLGFWQPENEEDESYEFLASIIEGSLQNDLKTGRIYKNQMLVNNFYWDIQDNGDIIVSLTQTSCTERPLSACRVIERRMIKPTGSNFGALSWQVYRDTNIDGLFDSEFARTYGKKKIDLTAIPEGEFWLLEPLEYYSHWQPYGKLENGRLSLDLQNVGSKPSTVSADMDYGVDYSFNFEDGYDTAIETQARFYVEGQGFKTFTVESWYENVRLLPSINNFYALSFEIKRKVIVPSDIPESSIDFADYALFAKISKIVQVVDSFIDGPEITAPETLYSSFDDQLNEVYLLDAGVVNEIEFTTPTTGYYVYKDSNKDTHSAKKAFTWLKKADGSLELTSDEERKLIIRFIRENAFGYSALMSRQVIGSQDYVHFAHDIVKEDPDIYLDDLFPGKFEFVTNDGYDKALVDLNADGTTSLSSNLEVSGGNWFIDEQGELVSYECISSAGVAITDYQQCFDSFDYVSTDEKYTSYSHIRRLKFLQRDGDDLIVKYDAIFWGGRWAGSEDYRKYGTIYRWKYLGPDN